MVRELAVALRVLVVAGLVAAFSNSGVAGFGAGTGAGDLIAPADGAARRAGGVAIRARGGGAAGQDVHGQATRRGDGADVRRVALEGGEGLGGEGADVGVGA